MPGRDRTASKAIRFALVASTLLIVAFLLSPYALSYVRSDSMAPAIPEGHAYLLEPVGEIREGDLVTFYSPTTDGYVTHRVVGETSEGYLTKGDANGYVDQSRGFEPVTRERIRGEVLTLAGSPLTVPFGRLLADTLADNVEYLLVGLLAVVGTLSVGGSARVLSVDQLIDRFVILGTALLSGALLASADRVLFVPARHVERTVVEFGLGDLPGVTYVFEAAGATVLGVNEGAFVRPEIAPETTGRVVLHYHLYLGTLPRRVLIDLHELQPAIAAVASVLPVSVAVWVVLRAFAGAASPARIVTLRDRVYPPRDRGGTDEG